MQPLRDALMILLGGLMFLAGQECTRAASAEPEAPLAAFTIPWDQVTEVDTTLEYLSQHQHVGIAPDYYGEPFIPDAMRRDAVILLPCENRRLDPLAEAFNGGAYPSRDIGLWSINDYWQRYRIAELGFTADQMYEPGPNTQVAVSLWRNRGPGAWTGCWR